MLVIIAILVGLTLYGGLSGVMKNGGPLPCGDAEINALIRCDGKRELQGPTTGGYPTPPSADLRFSTNDFTTASASSRPPATYAAVVGVFSTSKPDVRYTTSGTTYGQVTAAAPTGVNSYFDV